MITTIPIPDSDDTLDLAPGDDSLGYAASVTRRRNDGSDRRPAGGCAGRMDNLRSEGPYVIANSWSCYPVQLDPETDGEIGRTFTKQPLPSVCYCRRTGILSAARVAIGAGRGGRSTEGSAGGRMPGGEESAKSRAQPGSLDLPRGESGNIYVRKSTTCTDGTCNVRLVHVRHCSCHRLRSPPRAGVDH
jgi:hypothetical protein